MCERVELPSGGFAIVCRGHGDRRRRAPCVACGAGVEALCDHRNRDGRTCDAPLCRGCAHHVGKNRDYCPAHKRFYPVTAALPFEEAT